MADGQSSLEDRLSQFKAHGLSYPLQPGFYPEFPISLIRFDGNARASFVDLEHVDRIHKSVETKGLFSTPTLDEYGNAPDGMHRTLAVLQQKAAYAPVRVVEGLSGTRVSAASDSQRKYADFPMVIDGYYESFRGGSSLEEISNVSAMSQDAIRDRIRFIAQASDEVIYAVSNKLKGISVTHGVALSVLPHSEQNDILAKILSGKQGYTPSTVKRRVQERKQTIEAISKGRDDDIYKLPIFKADPKLCPTRRLMSDEEFAKFDLGGQKRLSNSLLPDGLFELEAVDSTTKTKPKEKIYFSETKLERLSKMYQTGILDSELLKRLDHKLTGSDRAIAGKILGFNPSSTLESAIERYNAEHPLKVKVCSVEDALGEINSQLDLEGDRQLKLSFGASYKPVPLDDLKGSQKNARGTLLETILSATEITESISQNGILQPILVYESGSGKHEVICGNRRYWASRMSEFYLQEDTKEAFAQAFAESLSSTEAKKIPGGRTHLKEELLKEAKYLDFSQKPTPQTSENIPTIFIPKGKLKKGDRALLQIAENSQKPFSLIEKIHLYNRVYSEMRESGKDHDDSIRGIAHSTQYSRGQIDRYIKYWEAVPDEIKLGYTHGLISQEMFDALADLPKDEILSVATKAIITGKTSRDDILGMSDTKYNLDKSGFQAEFFAQEEIRGLESSILDSLRSYVITK